MSGEQFYYVYALMAADSPAPVNLTGIASGEIRTMVSGRVAALVSPTSEIGPDPTPENMMAHQQVLSAVMQTGTVIPCAFGYVLPSRLVSRLLTETQGECLKLLAALRDKIEVGLKLIWKKEQFLSDIETPQIRELRMQAGSAGPAYQAELGELLQQAADLKRVEYQRAIYEPLAKSSVAAKLADLIGPRMILNGAFLIDRAGEADFDELVNRVCQPCLGKVDVRYTGPWPPYNFVTLRLRLEGG